MKWISVEDRLPDTDDYYLVWVPEWDEYGNVAHPDICWWSKSAQAWNYGYFASVEDGAPVSHWMLPEAPDLTARPE